MEIPDLLFAVAGAGALLAAALPRLVDRLPFSMPLGFLSAGFLFYLTPLDLPSLDPVEHRAAVEHTTEVIVIVALMGAGLALDRPFGRRRWRVAWRLVLIAMPVTVALVAAVAYGVAGLPVAAALLLGAVLAPTDPVLASDVQVGEPTEGVDDEDEVRFGLTAEAGLNDGAAFPVVYAAIAVATVGLSPGRWLGDWLLVDVALKTVVGVVGGVLVGGLLARVFFRSRVEGLRLGEHGDGFVALAVTFLAYGMTELAGGYGFVAVFVAACSIRAAERSHGYHHVLHGFIEQVERLLTAWLLLLLGGAVASGLLAPLTWGGALVGLALVFGIRPLVAFAAVQGTAAGWRERAVLAFYGIRGVGSLYYVAYATGKADFPAAELWAVVGFTIVLSVGVHGITATPVMRRLDRLRERVAAQQDRPAGTGGPDTPEDPGAPDTGGADRPDTGGADEPEEAAHV